MTLDQFGGCILLCLGAVAGIYLVIDGYGGWPMLWHDLKRHFQRKSKKGVFSMAKCWDYKSNKKCPHFYKAQGKDERVQVGTSLKRLDQFCFYCKATPGVKKIAGGADFTGRTPKWCPLGRDE